jgi:glyoxylase-like metal-dependent hydrolase (beta-lactamase superfamily II)
LKAAPAIHRIDLPTPFAVGTVNAHVIEDEPLTLVDCGPAWAPTLRALQNGLSELGYRLDDVELLLLTHQHVDHLGLARTVAEASGASVAALDVLEPIASNFESHMRDDDGAAAELMRLHGVEDSVVEVLRAVTRVNRHWGESVRIDNPLPSGAFVELRDMRLRLQHVPGHSPTDTLFIDDAHKIVFGGDHLLAHVSSNALVASGSANQPRRAHYPALLTYARSLRSTREMDISVIHTGHGEPVRDHRALIDRRLDQQESRATQILELLREQPLTAHQVAVRLWGRRALQQAYLTISEVIGHVDLLLDRGLVTEVRDETVVRFAVTEPR